MQITRKVTALAALMALLACQFMGARRASGAFIVESASGVGTAATPLGFSQVSDTLTFGSPHAIFAQVPTNGGFVTSYVGSALFEQSLALSGGVIADADSFALLSANIEFEVDATGVYRFAGASQTVAGGVTHARLRLDDTILAEVGLDGGQTGPIDTTQDVDLQPGRAYIVDFTASLSLPASLATTSLDFSLTPVPEPRTVILFAVGIVGVLLVNTARKRLLTQTRRVP